MTTYTIQRLRQIKVGPHWNSPTRYEWRTVGKLRAKDHTEATTHAMIATGMPADHVRAVFPRL